MSRSIVQALHSVSMLLTNLCKYVFPTRYPMPAIPIFPKQDTMRRNLPAEKRLTLDWRKARHLWSDWGEKFFDAVRSPIGLPDLHDVACRASWWCLWLILSLAHRIHVCYICLHLPYKSTKCRWIYKSTKCRWIYHTCILWVVAWSTYEC